MRAFLVFRKMAPMIDKPPITKEEIEAGIERTGVQKGKLAAEVGITPGMLSLILAGKRRVQVEEVPRFRRVLGLDQRPCRITGLVGGAGQVMLFELNPDELAIIMKPADIMADGALEVRGKALGTTISDGWFMLYDSSKKGRIDFSNPKTLHIIALSDGRIFIRRASIATRGYDLSLEPFATMTVPDVEWAIPARLYEP